ncbi:LEAF RUST 10 DISEASE-RESISTANCE LOCUS RECEPTOR-LIKE PROTEIN KINASE-like 2.1 [Gastrolobium bilobum]|uniref:LEAF RUST 10 DISEASE-RESISTANCE LOCUS RECEPTOR-LIKE PROTEIN KINASE-like 2.1 n=1 Tax=Gastrolobium bilobum TaxID=150636 RepID=UPI002AB207C6|nr:LEAF RUST 10 DISEASE-RESISTANCE LOCUS RECEPTOR-LIKE PROTEIN KINASE-like 2.1 [Gastrolobium bilobum]
MKNYFVVMCRGRALFVFLVSTLLLQQSSIICVQDQKACPPSSCGKISNISYPFRLRDDPERCGNKRYELGCENNVTVLYLYSVKYHVQAINYNNFTIRLVDPGVEDANCSSIPRYFLSQSNFTDTYSYDNVTDPYHAAREMRLSTGSYNQELLFQHIVYLNCTYPVIDNVKYVDTSACIKSHSNGYIYAVAGDLKAEDFEVGCHVMLVSPTSWSGLDTNIFSYTLMHMSLVNGFEISWLHFLCEDHCGTSNRQHRSSCFFNTSSQQIGCDSRMCHNFLGYWSGRCGIWSQLRAYAKDTFKAVLIGLLEIIKGKNSEFEGVTDYKLGLRTGRYVLPSFWAARFLFGVTLLIALFIHVWRKRRFSVYGNIEEYLQQNNLMPIGYSYKEIKKMARGFKDKLGEGGYGCVFKGKLRSGPYVAIKMLGKSSKANGQDFISEVATIGRIHHLNVVRLIGYCVEGSKRALVYEFMPNGSLDKFIFSKEGSIHLSYDKIYNISIGVARGIAYLHHGCEMQILHFDIKPYNILLDENFTPKVSDFGLAKLYPVDNSIVTLTAARGTIGYIAPELFYKNIGGVSYKADVYSFGMLLMEMANKRKNLNPHAEHSSQLYFPLWIYDQLGKEEDVEMEDIVEEEKKLAKKMIIVALWCIQLMPDDRPSMSKVVEMLEGDVESLEMPPKPSLYPHETIAEDQSIYSDQTISSDFISSYGDPVEIATNPLVENIT